LLLEGAHCVLAYGAWTAGRTSAAGHSILPREEWPVSPARGKCVIDAQALPAHVAGKSETQGANKGGKDSKKHWTKATS